MSKRLYRERERESARTREENRDAVPDTHFPYGRPSVSAWVAAASVAFAVFLLGGFVKTYRQLDQLQEESRREIADLRDSLRRLQSRLAAAPAAARSRLPSIGAAARPAQTAGGPQQGAPSGVPDPQTDPRYRLRPERAANANESTVAALPSFDDPEQQQRGIRYEWGRTSGAKPSRMLETAGGAPSQVVSVSGANRMVMIEGGRDLNLAEGARLELVRDGKWIADLRVQDVFGNQSSCEVLHATMTPQPGDTVRMPETGMQ